MRGAWANVCLFPQLCVLTKAQNEKIQFRCLAASLLKISKFSKFTCLNCMSVCVFFSFLILGRLKIHRTQIYVWPPLLKVLNGSNIHRACVCVSVSLALCSEASQEGSKIGKSWSMFGRLCSKSQTTQTSRQTAHVYPFSFGSLLKIFSKMPEIRKKSAHNLTNADPC